MSELSDFIASGLKICGAVDHERLTDVLVYAFEKEKADHGSVYARKPGESVEDRLELVALMRNARGVDPEKFDHFYGVLRLASYAYGAHKGDHTHKEKIRTLTAVLTATEANNEELSGVMSVSAASTASQWS
jgi:hypothetical protein